MKTKWFEIFLYVTCALTIMHGLSTLGYLYFGIGKKYSNHIPHEGLIIMTLFIIFLRSLKSEKS